MPSVSLKARSQNRRAWRRVFYRRPRSPDLSEDGPPPRLSQIRRRNPAEPRTPKTLLGRLVLFSSWNPAKCPSIKWHEKALRTLHRQRRTAGQAADRVEGRDLGPPRRALAGAQDVRAAEDESAADRVGELLQILETGPGGMASVRRYRKGPPGPGSVGSGECFRDLRTWKWSTAASASSSSGRCAGSAHTALGCGSAHSAGAAAHGSAPWSAGHEVVWMDQRLLRF